MGTKGQLSALENSEYLGDQVYIAESHGMIALYTYDGYTVTNLVWLEPGVLEAMNRWVSKRNAVSGEAP